ncbi:MAG: hypothetical protein NDI81_04785 [Desulfobacula sp.]|nr:hypothetical protein [Desulfobacula sp.]
MMQIPDDLKPENDPAMIRKQLSEYAMAFDLLANITHSCTEQEAVESVLQVFDILFSPGRLVYVSLENGRPDRVYSLLPPKDEVQSIKDRLTGFDGQYSWTQTGKGFRVLISHNDKGLGILEVDDLKFPEHGERYLNLTLSMVLVCGLAIENARQYQRIKEIENTLRKEKEKLEAALSSVKQLTGLLPICSHCKKIRDDKGYWNQIEVYIDQHSEAQFSHSICQECAKKYYPDFDLYGDTNHET